MAKFTIDVPADKLQDVLTGFAIFGKYEGDNKAANAKAQIVKSIYQAWVKGKAANLDQEKVDLLDGVYEDNCGITVV